MKRSSWGEVGEMVLPTAEGLGTPWCSSSHPAPGAGIPVLMEARACPAPIHGYVVTFQLHPSKN